MTLPQKLFEIGFGTQRFRVLGRRADDFDPAFRADTVSSARRGDGEPMIEKGLHQISSGGYLDRGSGFPEADPWHIPNLAGEPIGGHRCCAIRHLLSL